MTSEMGLRGRGRVRGRWRDGRSGRSSVPQTPSPPLGVALATIERRDLEDCITESHCPVLIANTQYLTSYNWVSEGEQDIIVPGEGTFWEAQYYHLTNTSLQVNPQPGRRFLKLLDCVRTRVYTFVT